MQNKMKLLVAFFLACAFLSCKKNVSMVTYQGGTTPVLSADKANIDLQFVTKDQEAIKLTWTNPDYKFSTGNSSQNVSYQIEIDTTGSNFTNPARKILTISNDLSKTFTQAELNGYLLNDIGLRESSPHNIEFRVKSSMANNSAQLSSNVMKFTVTPYSTPPKVAPPASGKLYITGGATPGSWMSGGDPELANQKFTQVTATDYILPSIHLTGAGSYLLVPVYGDWGSKFGNTGANNSNDPYLFDFAPGGGDILAPPATGDYKIEVDFQKGKVTVTKL